MDWTLITCHFGDPFWISHTLTHVDRYSDSRISRVIVIDQDRSSTEWLLRLPRVSEVIDFEPDPNQISLLGHDHPASLNRALRTISFDSTHVLLLDSDCFPVKSSWLDRLSDVTLASDPHYWTLSHPCLMAFPAQSRFDLDFAEGIADLGFDTGRLVGVQLAKSGYRVSLTQPSHAFHGYRGHYYLDGSVYHHGAASFPSAKDVRLVSQVNLAQESMFRRHVENGRFVLNRREYLAIRSKGAMRIVRGLRRR